MGEEEDGDSAAACVVRLGVQIGVTGTSGRIAGVGKRCVSRLW
jgi:hypothetical protein